MKKIFEQETLEGARDYLISKGIDSHVDEDWLYVTINNFHILVDDLDVEFLSETYNELKKFNESIRD